jgi:hypothetical protein
VAVAVEQRLRNVFEKSSRLRVPLLACPAVQQAGKQLRLGEPAVAHQFAVQKWEVISHAITEFVTTLLA